MQICSGRGTFTFGLNFGDSVFNDPPPVGLPSPRIPPLLNRPPRRLRPHPFSQRGIYIVEPTGPIIDDPNLTDKKFPGNPTQSYRSRAPLRVTGEVAGWQGHSPERLKEMKDHLDRLKAEGIEAIE